MSELALKNININKRTKSKFLDLGNCDIVGQIPEELCQCVWLEELSFSTEWVDSAGVNIVTKNAGRPNNISTLPSSFVKLTNLKNLWIKGIPDSKFDLNDLSAISELTNLEILSCSHSQVHDLNVISTLKNLKFLSFGNSNATSINFLSNFKNLEELYFYQTEVKDLSPLTFLSNLRILECNNSKIQSLLPIENLTRLEELDISDTHISDLSPLIKLNNLSVFQFNKTKVVDLEIIAGLINLRQISFSDCQISDLTPIAKLIKLNVLVCNNTQINDLTPISNLIDLQVIFFFDTKINDLKPLKKLINLNTIHCFNTLISDLSPVLWQDFNQLKTFSISNTLVKDISPILPLIQRKLSVKWKTWDDNAICLKDCPLSIPSSDVVMQGTEAILKYFEGKENQGEEKLYEAKIVIVGAGNSGKTTLINKLLDPSYQVPNPEKRTEGIKTVSFEFNHIVQNETKKLKAHLWDFGGQEIYHETHQLFLTPDTLYILLNDNRKNDTYFYYWLNIVTLRAKDKSPILTVFNSRDNSPRQIILGEDLYNEFNNLIRTPIDIDFADKDINSFCKLKDRILEYFSKLEVLGKGYPASWIYIRDALDKLPNEVIDFKQFVEICNEFGVHDISQIRVIAQTLYNIGSLLYFPDVFGLEDLIILKLQWCIDAMYTVLDIPQIKEDAGRFNENILAHKWSNERFSSKRLHLLKIMQYFDLCYPITGTSDYIAPQLLPSEENRFPDFPKNASIVYRFEYVFMPAGILTRLIARLSNYIKAPYVWRDGVTLEWEEKTIAEVIVNHFLNQIVIRVAGAESKRRLYEICKNLKDIHSSFKGLKFSEKIECNCEDCIKGINVTLYDLNLLEDDAAHDDVVTCRNGKRKKIPAKQILNGVIYVSEPRIFISYSHKNEDLKNEFRTMISPLEQEKRWKVWDDRWLLPGDKWNYEILRHLAEANVIILMLTADFFNSQYIYDIEMSRAIQRHESGDALVIGIIVSSCLWEETPLRKIQLIPGDGATVDSHANRNEIWKSLAIIIKEAIGVRNGMQNRKGGWNNSIDPKIILNELSKTTQMNESN